MYAAQAEQPVALARGRPLKLQLKDSRNHSLVGCRIVAQALESGLPCSSSGSSCLIVSMAGKASIATLARIQNFGVSVV